jgi:aminopeptidase N
VDPHAGQPVGASHSADSYLPDHGNGGYRVVHYDLDLTYKVRSNRLGGRALLTAVATQALARFSLDLGELKVSRVGVDGQRAAHSRHGRKLHVAPSRPLVSGATFVVDVHYSGNPRPVDSPWGDIGWDELTDGALVAAQPIGAPSWFPCNNTLADKAAYRISVTTETPYTVLATGVPIRQRRSAGTRTWVFERPEPTACYLAGVQIGRYAELELAGGRVPQTAAVPARLRKEAARDLARHAEIMTVLEEHFGPYPFGNYVVVVTDDELDDPVEAQGMSIFGANHVDGRRTHERLVVHELAHQWFGNSLTLADWRHIWLNEGFATYAEWLWSDVSGGRPACEHAREWYDVLAGQPADLVLADPGVDRLFDQRVYKRGALALHALRSHVGDQCFFDLLQAWTTRYRHGSVTTEQFTELARLHAGKDLSGLFADWLYGEALPDLPG